MCSVSKTWRLFFCSTFILVGLFGLLLVINPTGIDVYSVTYARVRPESATNRNLEFSRPKQIHAVYGEPGCSDNPRREDLFELLRAWTSASKELNINYTLACGSLLGAMRNQDLIPWDTDIDIMIDAKYFRILKRWSEEQKFTKADGRIRLAIQPGAVLNIPEEKRTRHNCKGEVLFVVSESKDPRRWTHAHRTSPAHKMIYVSMMCMSTFATIKTYIRCSLRIYPYHRTRGL